MSKYAELKQLCLKIQACGGLGELMRGGLFGDWINRVNPDAVLALIAESEQCSSRLRDVATLCATVEQERDKLRADLERQTELRRQEWNRAEGLKGECELRSAPSAIGTCGRASASARPKSWIVCSRS